MKNTDIKNNKVAEKLLAAAARISDVGQDLNAITSCMLDVADNAEASHILAWAGCTGDLTSDILDTADDIVCAIHDLIGSKQPRRLASTGPLPQKRERA